MNNSLKIEEFASQFNADQQDDQLLQALAQLTAIEDTQIVAEAVEGPNGNWFGWA